MKGMASLLGVSFAMWLVRDVTVTLEGSEC